MNFALHNVLYFHVSKNLTEKPKSGELQSKRQPKWKITNNKSSRFIVTSFKKWSCIQQSKNSLLRDMNTASKFTIRLKQIPRQSKTFS